MIYSFTTILLLFLSIKVIAKPLNLESFKQSSSVWVGTESFSINYKDKQVFHTTQKVQLIFTATNNTWIEKGSKIAILNHRKVELEEKSLQLEERKLFLTKKNLEAKYNESLLSINKQLDELKQQIELITKTSLEPGLPKRLRLQAKTLSESINSQKENLQRDLDEDLLATKLRLDLDELELAFLKKKQSHEVLLQNSIIKAPFSGIIEYNTNLYKENTSLWVSENSTYATLYNNKEIQLSCIPTSRRIQAISPKLLQVKFDLDLSTYHSEYVKSEKLNQNNRTLTKWIFHPTSENQDMSSLTGTTRICHLYYNFKEKRYIVPKEKIALLSPDTFDKEEWKGLVAEIWPTAKLTYIAPTSLVIVK